MVSSEGFVDYYSYLDLQKNKNTLELGNDFQQEILKRKIVLRLAKKYKLSPALDYKELVEILRKKIIEDSDINNYSAQKYYQLILALKTSSSLDEVARKSDVGIKRRYLTKGLFARQFNLDTADFMKVNLSQLIISDNGLYVVSLNSVSAEKIDLNYIFVPANTLEGMVEKEMSKAWIVSFVK